MVARPSGEKPATVQPYAPRGREPARATPLAQLQQAFEVAEFDAESCERREGVDDEPTAVAGDVIALVGIRFRLDRAVDADGVGDPLVFASGMRLTYLGAGRASQNAHPMSVCCITWPPRRRRGRPSSHGGRRLAASTSRRQ